MSDDFRHQLRFMIMRSRAAGVTLTSLASAAGVRQPLVSLAMRGSLVVKTENVVCLFEYLRGVPGGRPGAVEQVENERGLDRRLMDVLARLSDGSTDGDARLVGLLEAIAALRPDGEPR